MTRRSRASASTPAASLPELPLGEAHWQAIVQALGLSSRQAEVTELVLRGACDKEIARMLSITEPTLRTYRERIAARTSTKNRMELAMRVLAVSHEVRNAGCPQK